MIIYQNPKFGIFNIETNEYDIKIGWIQKQEPIRIIGEDSECYIERTYISEMGYWDKDGVRFSILKHSAIGPHKTRLINWLINPKIDFSLLGQQLTLF